MQPLRQIFNSVSSLAPTSQDLWRNVSLQSTERSRSHNSLNGFYAKDLSIPDWLRNCTEFLESGCILPSLWTRLQSTFNTPSPSLTPISYLLVSVMDQDLLILAHISVSSVHHVCPSPAPAGHSDSLKLELRNWNGDKSNSDHYFTFLLHFRHNWMNHI